MSCGSVQLGHPHMGHYLEDDDHDVVLHQHQHAGYRSLPHKSQQLRIHDGDLEGHGTTERSSRGGHYNQAQAQTTAGQAVPSTHNSFVVYPNYSSTVSTPRMRPQQNSLRGSLEAVQLAAAAEAGHGQPMAEFSIASDNLHSEVDSRSTVIEQRRPSNARSVNSIQSGSVTVDDAGFLVVQGVGGPVAHAMVETDSLGHHPDLIGDHIDGGHASSEDNLSHDSYELIETKMLGKIREMTPEQHQAQQERKTSTGSAGAISATGVGGGPSANQFEQEFYRVSKAKNGGTTAGSSRTSSRCSLNMSSSNMSPQVMPRGDVVKVALEHGNSPAGNSNSMSRVKSQDSFSQASNHNNRNNQNQGSLTSLVRSTNADPLNNNNQVIDENSQQSAQPRGQRGEPTIIQVPELKEESRLMVDIVRAGRGRGGAYISKNEVYSHSLPRSNADILYHHQQQQQQQQHQHQLHGGHQQQQQQVQQQHQQHQQHSRTLPSRRRERSPVYYSRSRIMSGGHGGPGGHPGECSSGSSSSHASPQIARPKSLEFAVVNVSALPNKQAFAYHDDSLELHHVPVSSRYGMEPPQPKPRLHLTKPQQIPQSDLYDDSSSAMNEQLSSSDVPQTPENPNVTFLPLEAGPVIVGNSCHQGIVRKQYYTTEERIYDVPEGIEGVSIPIKVITAQPPQVELVQDIVSPSTSSEITEEGNGHAHPVPSRAETEVMAAVGTGNAPPPKVAPPPPPPHQPVIAQHVLRQNHRGAASSIGLLDRPKGPPILPKVDIDPRKFHTIMHTMGPQDSTESEVSNQGHQRPIRPIRSRGTAQSHYSTTTLPPPQRALLATMSSTESESAMSARSAPTPISDPDRLLRARTISQEQQGPSFEIYQPMYPENQLEKPEILVEEPTDQEQSGSARDDDDPDDPDSDSPQLQVNLISPPAEESESSTAVLDSEGVPAPPPEFSGAAPLSVSDEEAKEQATDVEEDSQSCHLSKHQISKSEQALLNQPPETAAGINVIVTDDTTDIVLANDDENKNPSEPLEVDNGTTMVSLPSIGGASYTEDDIGVLSELPCAAAAAIAHMTGSTTADLQSSDGDAISFSATITGSQAENKHNIKETDKVVQEEILDDELVVSEEEEASSKVIKIADLYVKIEHGEGSGSTISDEGNTGSDTAPVPFIDEDECKSEIIEEKAANLEVVSLPIHQHAEAIFIPPTPPTSNLSTKSEELESGDDVVEEATEATASTVTASEAVHPDAPQPPSPDVQTASPIPEETEVPIDSSNYPENQLSDDDENDDVKMHKPENKIEISDDIGVMSELPSAAAAAIAHMTGSTTADLQSIELVTEEPIGVSNGEESKVIHAGASVGGFIGRLPSLPTNSSTTMSSIDLDIPPPPSHCDLKDSAQPSIESTSSTTVSPPPPPPMLLDGTEGSGPPTAVPCPPPDTEAFPFPPRTLSRISEGGSTITSQITNAGGNGTGEDGVNGKPTSEANEQLICSRSGSEGGPDTMTDQNCTTSEDADNNPPSLNSDLPENLGRGGGGSVMRAIAEIEARAQQQLLMQGDDQPQYEVQQPQRVDSKDLPSPPSSMINTTTEEVTQEGKTEMTLVDSLYLELSPAPQQNSTQWENCSSFALSTFLSTYFISIENI